MDEAQAFLQKMKEQRKFSAGMHSVLAAVDFPFLKAMNQFSEAGYLNDRLLSRKLKELIFIAISAVKGGDKEHLKMHMHAAIKAGATKEEILEVVELLSVPTGMMTLRFAMDAWIEAFNPERVDGEGGQ
jgi:AhpD family alkylhydroperoxidase